ncbi:hypothetical protein F5876DRAFT_70888 [Lentinula aff. lateritia]|uniref:Uncharacterized protein n=1 Tax=Lentinula aff. lateritia TaxID=2804960 RepID=A0ACC1THG5_9AGAR|nr:hypothetical protein F5876DRAFT_70888 [Lentinula aff. lateritia]
MRKKVDITIHQHMIRIHSSSDTTPTQLLSLPLSPSLLFPPSPPSPLYLHIFPTCGKTQNPKPKKMKTPSERQGDEIVFGGMDGPSPSPPTSAPNPEHSGSPPLGILFSDSRPAMFWSLRDLTSSATEPTGPTEGVQIWSATGRMCAVVVTRRIEGGTGKGDEGEKEKGQEGKGKRKERKQNLDKLKENSRRWLICG